MIATVYYTGFRSLDRPTIVNKNGHPLDPRFDLRRHSPDGFNWGYCGSGPAQLALALVADVLGDDAAAQAIYQKFKSQVVAGWERDTWQITSDEILQWVDLNVDLRAFLERN